MRDVAAGVDPASSMIGVVLRMLRLREEQKEVEDGEARAESDQNEPWFGHALASEWR